jgi:N,N'-diacetyllegionaminate synthase
MLPSIRIGKTGIGGSFPCFIVAELGVNHNRDLNLAKQSIIKIAESGADAVKVQTWKTDNIILENCRLVDYQQINTGSVETQYPMLKNLELPFEWHNELKTFAEEKGLVFFSTMEDKESVDFLINEIRIPRIRDRCSFHQAHSAISSDTATSLSIVEHAIDLLDYTSSHPSRLYK